MAGTSEFLIQAARFKRHLAKTKALLGESEFRWYPYDSLATLETLDGMLRGPIRAIVNEPRGTVLDIGCADGDLAFFLESLGFRVIAMDHPATNWNGMRGVRKLREHFHSQIEIVAADLDSRFELPQGPFDLVLVLGLLYHLKNPYYLLELFAEHARFCFLTTRVARFTPEGMNIRDTPVAYLVDPHELNQDSTNFWIFSEAGLKRLLRRSGWQLCSFQTAGNTRESNPHSLDRDERAFCILRNRFSTDPCANGRLLHGWYKVEEGHWRWTQRVFSIECPIPKPDSDATLELRFLYPDRLYEVATPLEVKASLAGSSLPPKLYSTTGEHLYQETIPARMLREPYVSITFELSHSIPPSPNDPAERGIIVLNLGLL